MQIAVNEINAAGGFNGKPVGLAVADAASGSDPTVARTSLDTLLNTERRGCGHGTGVIGHRARPARHDAPVGHPAVLGLELRAGAEHRDSGGYYFRTAPPDRLQALALGRMVLADGKRKPVLVIRNDSYGNAFATGTPAGAEERAAPRRPARSSATTPPRPTWLGSRPG